MPGLAEKVAFLSQPHNHPFSPSRVTVVETHMSWVFLTDLHAYKLKKAIVLDGQDLTATEAREAQCRNEVALNARLSHGVYLGMLPLTVNARGELQLDLGGRIVDWLVWMRRLPEERMLDRQIAMRRVDVPALRECVAMLAGFYESRAPLADLTTGQFRDHLAARIAENRDALAPEASGPRGADPASLCARQADFLAAHSGVFDQRVIDSRIVEGHGDLRPEHVCLESPPQVIDCLEFSRSLRIVDAAEELGFLAMECERLGAPELGAVIFDEYRRISGDNPPAPLVHFYKSVHACVRAKLAAWHFGEPGMGDGEKWRSRARDYLRFAAAHLADATSTKGSSAPALAPRPA